MLLSRSTLINLLKFAFAGGLIYYLVVQGTLDFSQFGALLERPDFILIFAVFWVVGPVVVGALRWHVLLTGLEVYLSRMKAMQLQMIGFFFNVAMPGVVGGDLIKALYVMKHNSKQKAEVMISVFIDRICGLASMFILAAGILLVNLSTVMGFEDANLLILMVVGCMVGASLFFATVFLPYSDERDPFHRLLRLSVPGFGVLRRLYESLRMFRHKPMAVINAILYGCLIQFSIMLLYSYIFGVISPDQEIPFASVALAYPLGALVSSIPISPGGLGVGHVAFDRLFEIVGISGGANAFNIFILIHMAFNLLGCIPFLFYRAHGEVITASEIEKATG